MSSSVSAPVSLAPVLHHTYALTRAVRTRPAAVQGTLALEWRLPGDVAAVPSPGPALRLVTREPALDQDTDPAVAMVPTSRSQLPDPGPWTAQLVQAFLEVLGRERPVHQLVRWLTPEVYADLTAHLAATAPSPAAPGRAPATRVVPGHARRTVSTVHVSEPADGVVEASAVVLGGRRARAVAVRLEGWDGRWRCTRLAVV